MGIIPDEASAEEDLTLEQAWKKLGICESTLRKYLRLLDAPVIRPGIGSKRVYLSLETVGRVSTLMAHPSRLKELTYRKQNSAPVASTG